MTVVYIIIFAVVIPVGLILSLRRIYIPQPVWERLAGTVGPADSNGYAVGSHGGTTYKCKYTPGTRHAPPSFQVELEGVPGALFRIVREGMIDRYAKRFGVACEMQTLDARFDSAFYIEGEPDNLPRGFLSHESQRHAVDEIMSRGFTSIENAEGVLTATYRPFKVDDKFGPACVAATVADLSILRGSEGSKHDHALIAPKRWRKRATVWVVALVAMTMMAGIAPQIFPPLAYWDFALWTLTFSVGGMLLFLTASFAQLRGRSTAHRELMRASIMCALLFPVGGWAMGVFLNGALDGSAPERHDAVVVAKGLSGGKGKRHYAVVKSWRHGGTEDVSVGRREFEAIVPHRSVLRVVSRAGAFGFEWVVARGLADD